MCGSDRSPNTLPFLFLFLFSLQCIIQCPLFFYTKPIFSALFIPLKFHCWKQAFYFMNFSSVWNYVNGKQLLLLNILKSFVSHFFLFEFGCKSRLILNARRSCVSPWDSLQFLKSASPRVHNLIGLCVFMLVVFIVWTVKSRTAPLYSSRASPLLHGDLSRAHRAHSLWIKPNYRRASQQRVLESTGIHAPSL